MNPKSIREQTIRDAKVNLILDAARKVFSEKGFHEARLEDIAAAAGFSKASLYNYYEDKENIFMTLAAREYCRVMEKLQESIDKDRSFLDNIRESLRIILSVFGEHFAIILAISSFRVMNILNMQRLCEEHEKKFDHFRDSYAKMQEIIVELISLGKKRGEVKSSLDNETLAQYYGSILRGVLFEWKVAGKVGEINLEIDRIVTFLKEGMAVD